MFGQKEEENQATGAPSPQPSSTKTTAQDVSATNAKLLTVAGDYAKIEGTFEIADSLEVECEIGGELNVRGKLTIGQQGVVTANVRTVDAVIKGSYEGNMVATGNVEIAATGRVMGNITTDSLVISKGGFFNGNVSRIEEKDKEQKGLSLVDQERRTSPTAVGGTGGSGSSGGTKSEEEDKKEDEEKKSEQERLMADRGGSSPGSRNS